MMMRHKEHGFTLVELMIVVVIISILAAIASVGYKKYVGRARLGEVAAILSEMSSKETMYYSEFAAYLPLRADGSIALPSPDESTGAFYPIAPDNAAFESARTATSIANSAAWPQAWRSVGLRPLANQLYCTYLLNAGGGGVSVPGALGKQMLQDPMPATSPAWFYGLAACNLNGPSGYPAGDTILGLTSASPSLRTFNEGQ